jgi:hypothetical protein
MAELGGDPLDGDKRGCVEEGPIEDWQARKCLATAGSLLFMEEA